MDKPSIAFIGLGAMGTPMARNLLAGGFEVTVFNRSRQRAEALIADGANVADTPAAHAELGSLFLTAPVFGRPEAAAAKKLWVCQSGAAEAKARARQVLEALGQGVHDFGEDPGAANVVKLSGNFLIFSAVEALAEALALVEKNGIDRNAVAGFLEQTIFACPIYQNYGRLIAKRPMSLPASSSSWG